MIEIFLIHLPHTSYQILLIIDNATNYFMSKKLIEAYIRNIVRDILLENGPEYIEKDPSYKAFNNIFKQMMSSYIGGNVNQNYRSLLNLAIIYNMRNDQENFNDIFNEIFSKKDEFELNSTMIGFLSRLGSKEGDAWVINPIESNESIQYLIAANFDFVGYTYNKSFGFNGNRARGIDTSFASFLNNVYVLLYENVDKYAPSKNDNFYYFFSDFIMRPVLKEMGAQTSGAVKTTSPSRMQSNRMREIQRIYDNYFTGVKGESEPRKLSQEEMISLYYYVYGYGNPSERTLSMVFNTLFAHGGTTKNTSMNQPIGDGEGNTIETSELFAGDSESDEEANINDLISTILRSGEYYLNTEEGNKFKLSHSDATTFVIALVTYSNDYYGGEAKRLIVYTDELRDALINDKLSFKGLTISEPFKELLGKSDDPNFTDGITDDEIVRFYRGVMKELIEYAGKNEHLLREGLNMLALQRNFAEMMYLMKKITQ